MREQEERIQALEGKTIRAIMDEGRGEEYTGRILYFDPDVGITIVNAENEDEYLFCCNGPSAAPNNLLGPNTDEQWEKDLAVLVPMLERGEFDYVEFVNAINGSTGCAPPSVLTCPFAQ